MIMRPNIEKLVAGIKRQQEALAAAATKLREESAITRAKIKQLTEDADACDKDATWAERVADKFGDLIK